MLLATLLAASSFPVGKAITMDMDPALLTLLRFMLATLFFLPFVVRHYKLKLPERHTISRYSMVSGTLVAFFWFMFLALRYTSPLNTSVIFTLVPGISWIYSALLLKERLGLIRVSALVMALFGALWVIFSGDLRQLFTLSLNKGDALFFLGCLILAFYTPLIKLFHKGEPMVIMTFWILATGCCWLLLFTIPQLLHTAWKTIAPRTWLGICYLAVFATIITFFLTQWSVLRLGPTRVMAYSYLYPPCILMMNILLGHSLPPWRTVLGIVFLIPAMVILQKGTVVDNFPEPQ